MRGLTAQHYYWSVGVAPQTVRGITTRWIEWRARRRTDPAERLQFLQSRLKRKRRRVRAPVPAITLGLALAGAALLRPWSRSSEVPRVESPRLISTQISTKSAPAAPPHVWLVENAERYDLYSNGLRVENQYLASTAPRKYLAFARARLDQAAGAWRSEPAGIVFHTTESHIAPFEEDQNRTLRRAGEGLLEYVSRRRSYHFVIDRFGRVFRIVRETDYANHAGNSIWADDTSIYLNLNQSFFGVAFEAQSNPDGDQMPANSAQIHAGRILVEMLRSRYAIPASNCVAHAQVSVNPGNGRVGYHTDWAARLPFGELGLGDNYLCPLPSVTLFGFQPDGSLAEAGDAPLGQGWQSALEQVRAEAARRELPVERYRQALQKRYRYDLAAQRTHGVPEDSHGSDR
ncbi:MAG: N-acetylmuramoyl-L-alanine amidase [Acidobacteriia bacterium]|nr:N-acetylmuramoyl-L-alanine amidase [Terriglobia bacterium]